MDRIEAEVHSEEMHKIINSVTDALANNYPDEFDGLDFVDMGYSAGINIRLFHKQIPGYAFGPNIVLRHSWLNVDMVI